MTTKEQVTTEQRSEPGDAPVSGDHDRPLGPQAVIPGWPDAVSHVVVSRLMGKKHWAAGWVLGMCNADPQFLVHFAEQSRGYVHFLCLIHMALAKRETDNSNAQDDARMLRAGNKRKLLKELFPSCPPGIVNLLHKLPKKPLPADAYRKLMGALEYDGVRKGLYHTERIKKSVIFMLNEIALFPEQFRSVAMRCIKNFGDYERFWRVIRIIKKFDLKVTEHELALGVRQGIHFHDADNWLARKVSILPFPAPPWNGDGEIRPLRSLGELKDAAKALGNCLTSVDHRRYCAFHMVTGDRYLYVCDHIPAMIEVRLDDFWGWSIREIGGKADGKVTVEQEYEIRRKFCDAGISPVWKARSEDFNDDIPF